MNIELTEKHLESVERGEPFRFTDPERATEFVVLKADVYDRIKMLLASHDADPELMYPLLAEISPEDWEEPSAYGITPKS